MIYISGAVSFLITPEDIRNLYSNLERTLQYYGAGFEHVVKENLYTTDIEAMKKQHAVRKSFYKGDFPVATRVQISRLFTAEALVNNYSTIPQQKVNNHKYYNRSYTASAQFPGAVAGNKRP